MSRSSIPGQGKIGRYRDWNIVSYMFRRNGDAGGVFEDESTRNFRGSAGGWRFNISQSSLLPRSILSTALCKNDGACTCACCVLDAAACRLFVYSDGGQPSGLDQNAGSFQDDVFEPCVRRSAEVRRHMHSVKRYGVLREVAVGCRHRCCLWRVACGGSQGFPVRWFYSCIRTLNLVSNAESASMTAVNTSDLITPWAPILQWESKKVMPADTRRKYQRSGRR